ncbi:hypothetical protein SUDANB120_02866 [Streptomyces sp. enrichment culture]|uniref:hypothetical protein n=1 Tax=Streptomyces sp. enrichment culture TaxID=1795815 RepID=UPI003F56F3D7
MTDHHTTETGTENGTGTAPAPAAPARRRGAAALRLLAAAAAFAAFGTGTAYGIMQADRTDLPGLETRGDGRWDYPVLAKPTLAPGAPQPFSEDNADGTHYAALFQLLLPAPRGSAPDPALKVEQDQKVSEDTFLEEFEPTVRQKLKQEFTDEGLRQIAGRGWTMPDGSRTRVYLLRFSSPDFADDRDRCGITMNIKGVNRIDDDDAWTKAELAQPRPARHGTVDVFAEAPPVGDEEVRVGCIQSGDVQAAVFQSRKGGVATVPFHQTVVLQSQLLG